MAWRKGVDGADDLPRLPGHHPARARSARGDAALARRARERRLRQSAQRAPMGRSAKAAIEHRARASRRADAAGRPGDLHLGRDRGDQPCDSRHRRAGCRVGDRARRGARHRTRRASPRGRWRRDLRCHAGNAGWHAAGRGDGGQQRDRHDPAHYRVAAQRPRRRARSSSSTRCRPMASCRSTAAT